VFQSLFSWNPLLCSGASGRPRACARCFNPCSRGTLSSAGSHFLLQSSLFGVSILVLVEPSPLRHCWQLSRSPQLVSILVLVEPSPLHLPGGECVRGERVSILVLVEPSPLRLRKRTRSPVRLVSILVLVEPSPLPSTPLPAQDAPGRFNPCSRGTLSSASRRETAPDQSACFNPCSRGTLSSATHVAIVDAAVGGFQSLFSWNPLLCDQAPGAARGVAPVSILVLVEPSPLRGLGAVCPGQDQVSILVLVEPSPLPDGGAYVFGAQISEFQSLFSWNPLLCCCGCDRQRCREQVSILVLVEPSPLQASLLVYDIPSGRFQSLFSWNPLLCPAARGEAVQVERVSILVLVEPSPLLHRARIAHQCPQGFQSLFSWNPLLCTAPARSSSLASMFQSLFSWNPLLCSPTPLRMVVPLLVSILVLVEPSPLPVSIPSQI
jgi:hypothetical protein